MNYNIYPQQQQYVPPAQQYRAVPNYYGMPQVRPVSSIEEVKASPIDFDGSTFYFPDIANKRIYTKSINIDGTVAISVYELQADQPTDSTYITRKEFEEVIKELKTSMMQEVEQPTAQQQPQIQF